LFSFDLLANAIISGVLLGCFYAAVSIGLSVSFGLLDVPFIAHPAIVVLGSYGTFLLGRYDLDPILAGIVLMPPFFVLGVGIYRFYYETFAKRGTSAELRGLAFFFGLTFVIEVGLILVFGVDQRMAEAAYIGKGLTFGEIRLPMRMIVAFGMAIVLTVVLTLYLSQTYIGRAIRAVAQDEVALRLMGANPVRIKQWAFGIATAVSALGGALLIIVLVGLSRVYLGVHYPSDVVAGILLGAGWATYVALCTKPLTDGGRWLSEPNSTPA